MAKNRNILLLERFLDGLATKQEVKELLENLDKAEFEHAWMKEQWDSTNDKMNPIVQKQILENIQEKIGPQRTFKFRHWLSLAAAVLLVFSTSLSGYLIYKNSHVKSFGDMTVAVEKGQKASVLLPDGSRVWVNSGSTLTYGNRYNSKERIINLDGEAYFEVAKNEHAPFIVQSHGFSVKALGTAFDVKAYPEDNCFSAVLVHGKVEVGDDVNKIYLTPNQKVVYERLSKTILKTDIDDSRVYDAWRHNELVFESETFEDIAAALERSYNVKLVFESQSLRKYHYSGTLENTSLESLLQLFAMTSPLSYRVEGSTIYLFENKAMKSVYQKILR